MTKEFKEFKERTSKCVWGIDATTAGAAILPTDVQPKAGVGAA
ncbi:MAG: hypothetical protein JWN70_241 [Planctomycetaceae bacterium]|nr:hypothetical protein [Planctomycetaceae bacterium]